MRSIWNGRGDVGEAAYFTKYNGSIAGRPYVRARAARYLASLHYLTRKGREEILTRTIDNDEWLAPRHGMLVAAVCRDVATFVHEAGLS